jgi:hypothetical protein
MSEKFRIELRGACAKETDCIRPKSAGKDEGILERVVI